MSKVKGFNGAVEFNGRAVIISRKGAGSKTVPVSAIQSVEYKPSGLMVGYVRFDVAGSQLDAGKIRNKTQGLLRDANTVTFHRGANADFQALVDEVNAALYA